MLTKINPKKVYANGIESTKDVLDAVEGEWGKEVLNGLNVASIGRVKLLSGIFSENVTAVDLPYHENRFAGYFHDSNGNSNMVIVEARQKMVAKPKNIIGGFTFFAIV